jgi:hypothetical protein
MSIGGRSADWTAVNTPTVCLEVENAMENSTERHANRLAKPDIACKRDFSVLDLVHDLKGFADGLMQSHEWSCRGGI